MCGRFALANPAPKFGKQDISMLSKLPAEYNISPSNKIFILKSVNGNIEVKKTKWGIPFHSNLVINARQETAMEKYLFKNLFYSHRIIILATGFYEWDKLRNPYYFFSDSVIGFAGLAKEEAVILTMNANKSVKKVHHRMPLIINPESIYEWLNPNEETSSIDSFVNYSSSKFLKSHQVSKSVNLPNNNTQELISSISVTLFS
jgi:putative SOS response-associated peptidase YedK